MLLMSVIAMDHPSLDRHFRIYVSSFSIDDIPRCFWWVWACVVCFPWFYYPHHLLILDWRVVVKLAMSRKTWRFELEKFAVVVVRRYYWWIVRWHCRELMEVVFDRVNWLVCLFGLKHSPRRIYSIYFIFCSKVNMLLPEFEVRDVSASRFSNSVTRLANILNKMIEKEMWRYWLFDWFYLFVFRWWVIVVFLSFKFSNRASAIDRKSFSVSGVPGTS